MIILFNIPLTIRADINPINAPATMSRNQCTPEKTRATPTIQENIRKIVAKGAL